MNFKATTNAKTLFEWLRTINAVADECIFDLSEVDVVVVRVVDPANALLLDMRMPDHAWDELDAEAGRFGVDIAVMMGRLKTFDPLATITLSMEAPDKLKMSGGSAWYTIPVLDPDNLRKPPEYPSLHLPARATIGAERLQQCIKQATSVSDHIRVGLDTAEGCMFFRAAGDDCSYGDTASFDGEVVVLAEHRVEASSLFSLDYTESTVRNTAGDVVVELGRDLPMVIAFVLHDAIVRYVQAPRIEKE